MNNDEKIAYQFLKHYGFKEIKFEPDGNIPPDFFCDAKIAVEVRRLNIHIKQNNKQNPIEELYYKLMPKLIQVFKEIKNDFQGNTVLVSIKYKRPLNVNSKLINLIKSKLHESIPFNVKSKFVSITQNLSFRLYNSTKNSSQSIKIGSIMDMDTGISIVSNIYENLKIALIEKEKKVKPFLNKYNLWWLILINHIWDNLDEMDIKQIHDCPDIKTIFNRIILLSPNDFKKIVEIKINKASA